MATYFIGMQRRTIFLWTFNEQIFLLSFNIFMDTLMNVSLHQAFSILAAHIVFYLFLFYCGI